MELDFEILEALRKNHPGWKLLLADSAPLVVSFFHRTFVQPNIRVEKNDRRWGRQRLPAKIYFARTEEFLASIGKIRETERFIQNVQLPRSMCPELEQWLFTKYVEDRGERRQLGRYIESMPLFS